MKFASSLALAAALLSGSAAIAQKAKKGEAAAQGAAYQYNLGKAFRAAAAPAQAALKAQDAAGARAKIDALDAVATNPDEKFVAAQLRLQLSQITKDQAQQEAAVLAMVNSGSGAAAGDLGRLNFYAGNFAYGRGDYANAIRYLTAAEAAGNRTSDVYLLLAESNFKANQVQPGLAYVDKAVAANKAAGQAVPQNWYARAASVAYKAKLTNEATKWTRAQVEAYPTADNWRSALVIYRDAQKDPQAMIDIYRLMRVVGAMDGERDYFEYAALASERGMPGEAKSVIEEGFANGKAPRSSRALNELLQAANGRLAADRASLATSERQAQSSANGRLASNTADAYLGYGDYAKAATLYRLALSKGGVDANAVNTRLGIALARSGDKAGAKAAFAQVTGERSNIAAFWNLYLDRQA